MSWLDDMIPFLKDQESLHDQVGVDVEGHGKLTYGYGHLDADGVLGNKISQMNTSEYQAWSDSTLTSDLNKAYVSGRQSFSNIYSGATHDVKTSGGSYTTDYSVYDSLPDNAKAIITDFQFNLGNIKGYPKLMNALKDGDWETVKKEYKRTLGGKELTKRNKGILDKYISPSPLNKIKTDNKVFNQLLNTEKSLF